MINKELKLWDPTEEEVEQVEKKYPEFYERIENWFYLANDYNFSKTLGKVSWVERGKVYDDYIKYCRSGAAVIELTPKNLRPLITEMRQRRYLDFNLVDEKGEAFFAQLKVNDKFKYFLVIKNKEEKISIPFSKKGCSRYRSAIEEQGSLANQVNSGKILEYLPEKYRMATGISCNNDLSK